MSDQNLINKMKSHKVVKDLMTRYYMGLKMAEMDENQKLAWVTSGAPVELVYAFGMSPVYPENHGALCGATKTAVGLAEVAEKEGYSRDLCSYFRTDIGSALTKGGPVMGLPKPDILICCNNICGTVLKWYEIQARYFDAPLVIIDTPFAHGEVQPHAVQYVKTQMEDMIAALERVTGKKWDEDNFHKVVDLAVKGIALWKRALSTCEHKPAPMSCFDAFVHIAPIVCLRGTDLAIEYYESLIQELEERVEQNIGIIVDEKYRILWDNIPIWYELRGLSEFFAEQKTCLVADTYTNAWAFDELDAEGDLEDYAKAYASVYLNVGMDEKIRQIKELVKRFQVHGMIMHSNRSCKPYSLGQYDIQKSLINEMGLPCFVLEADMTDQRSFSKSKAFDQLQTFIESLK